MKEIDINIKFDNLINYISSLNKKIDSLEKEIKNTKNENNDLKQIINKYGNKIKELEKKIENFENNYDNRINKNINVNTSGVFKNSNIIKSDDIDLILSWLEKKPSKIELLLNSKIEGDLNKTFHEK